ncbi:helix-turn-helix domain-containing protein [Streptomyces sp. NPDC051569]|uniref:helix-turn-helix domain-containing protein n=1 Tax=Streptomyces sp. NPDC051569 TaxID=3365661 RepID=UPI00379DC860
MSSDHVSAEFGRLLRSYRLRARLTQPHLADLTMLSVRGIRNLELGKVRSPRRDTVRLLADGLGLAAGDRETLLKAAAPPAAGTPGSSAGFEFSPPWGNWSTLIGREGELALLTEWSRPPGRRLVTVTGVSGVGKSRLATEAARRHRPGTAGATYWLPAADGSAGPSGARLTDRDRTTAVPASPAETVEILVEAIQDRDVLLVLDDPGTMGLGAPHIASLIDRCPGLRVLATAPGPFGLPGEQVLPLAPLALPPEAAETDPDLLGDSAAVRLLLTRIRCLRPEFRLSPAEAPVVARLCRRLDGLPRALEYAGGWCLVRSLEHLLADVDRNPFQLGPPPMTTGRTRHPSALLRRSVRALDPRAERFLASVARLGGSWSIAEVAWAVGVPEDEAASAVFTLITYGLLRDCDGGVERRFSALHQVRQLYADAVRPPQSPAAAVARRPPGAGRDRVTGHGPAPKLVKAARQGR